MPLMCDDTSTCTECDDTSTYREARMAVGDLVRSHGWNPRIRGGLELAKVSLVCAIISFT